jgi:hypothetical protein
MVRCGWPLYRLIFWTWEPPPLLIATPPPALVRCGNGDQTIWAYHLSTWPRGRRTANVYFDFESSVIVLRSNREVRFAWDFFGIPVWISAQRLGSSLFPSLIIIIFSSPSRNFTTCFNPRGKVSCFAFFKVAMILHQFPQWVISV